MLQSAKYILKSKNVKQNYTRSENFDFSYCQTFIFRMETGHKALTVPKFQISLIFPNLLRSQVVNREATYDATLTQKFSY